MIENGLDVIHALKRLAIAILIVTDITPWGSNLWNLASRTREAS
jgi:hypothetical protein